MTKDEAVKVLKIVGEADGGCSVCVEGLFNLLKEEFPEFKWRALVRETFADEYPWNHLDEDE